MGIDRRDFVRSAALATAGAALGPSFAARGKEERPNVLLILVDQMRHPRWFPEDEPLPAYQRLRSEGLSFTNHFTSAVPCSPSRATLFTGRHVDQHQVYVNTTLVGANQSLDPGITTLGHLFQQAGYRTPYFGKWHLVNNDDYKSKNIEPYGFEHWETPDRDGLPYEGLMRDPGFAGRAIKWLERHGKEGPWFLTCSLINPHDICYYSRLDVPTAMVPNVCDALPENWDDELEDKPAIQEQYRKLFGIALGMNPGRSKRAWINYLNFYYYLTKKIDELAGKVLDALDRLGLSENTLVIFTSDHGEMCGSHRLQSKGPFVYHENNQVPLIMRWPQRIQPGSEAGALTQSVDFFPTLLELAGIRADCSHLPGKSAAPLVQDPAADLNAVNDHVCFTFGYSNTMGLNRMAKKLGLPEMTAPMQIRALYDGRYKFARYFEDHVQEEDHELYDLENDPLEMRNLARDPGCSKITKSMKERLRQAEEEEMGPIL